MRILGHGIDLVDNARIAKMLEDHGTRFLDRVYTAVEQEYAEAGGKRRIERLAGRFAVKEAVLKALGTGWRNGIAWTDLEIAADPLGRPMLHVEGEAKRLADRLGVLEWHISLSHTAEGSIGSAIAVGWNGAERSPSD